MVADGAELLDEITVFVVANPCASLAEIAAGAGMSRTSLHSRYPSRQDLIDALAESALDAAEAIYRKADLDSDDPLEDIMVRLTSLVMPEAPKFRFIANARTYDLNEAALTRIWSIDADLIASVTRAQKRGDIDPLTPPWWVSGLLFAAIWTAWDAIDVGLLAPLSAPELVARTVLTGVRAHQPGDPI